MKENHFIFADLSTYDLGIAQSFYEKVFGWNYQSDGTGYWTAGLKGKDISGLYESPQKFKDMGMPSFWMSYIQVNDLEKTVAQAKGLGGIIEVVETDNPIGKIALIRDPLGAGFTIYEGDLLDARTVNTENSLVWNELFISDIQKVKAFYEGIFNWTIKEGVDGIYDILDDKGEKISAIQEISNEIKAAISA
ncbi:MAG: VOC family protein [Bacteroidota bacterium]